VFLEARLNLLTKIGMITCWYENISMANYSKNLKEALEKNKGLQVKIVSSHCLCRQWYAQRRNIFEDECKVVSIPYLATLTNTQGLTRIFAFLTESLLHFFRALQYWAETKDCDIVHYQQSASYSFGMLPLFFLLLLPSPKKRIVTIHNIDQLSLNPKLKFLNKAYRRATKIVVHSRGLRKIAKSLGIPEHKIAVIPHGSQSVQQYGLERKEITFFGAPIERKGFSTVLEALKILKDRGQKLSVNIYGIYSEKDKDIAISKAKSIGVNDQLIWGGRLTETEFDRKMQESLFTFATYARGFMSGSNIVTRAMANATPIIASNVGTIPEYLGEGGVLVPPNNPTVLAEAIEMLLKDKTRREMLGEKGKERAQKLFPWNRIAEKTAEIYEN